MVGRGDDRPGGLAGHRVGKVGIQRLDVTGPAALEPGLEHPAVLGGDIAHGRWERRIPHVGAAAVVEVLIRLRCDLEEPVSPASRPIHQEPFEEMARRQVVKDIGPVLTAHQVDVVHPEISRDLLVAGGLVLSLPLDDPRRPAPQTLPGSGEGGAVLPGRRELTVVFAPGASRPQTGEMIGGDMGDGGRLHVERSVEVTEAEHGQACRDLGDFCAQRRHQGARNRGAN